MPDTFPDLQQQLIQARNNRDTANEQWLILRARLTQVENELRTFARAGKASPDDPTGARLVRQRDELSQQVKQQQAELAKLNEIVANLSGRFGQVIVSPQTQVETLDNINPFLLFPVRLETKFMPISAGQTELWVRIFPDDIAIETHERPLTAEEIQAGQIYWEAIWRAGHDATIEKGAWRVLVNQFGVPRGAWIAKQMTPTNNDQRPSAPVPSPTPLNPPPQFPQPDLNQASWSRAPRVRIMPDRFVILTYVGTTQTHAVVGNLIPDPLIVGPDPMQMSQTFQQKDGELQVDPAMAWLTNFDQAVQVGMGIRIPLTPSEARFGFDRVFALGLRLSSNQADSMQRLENLFEGHHYSSGLSLIPQGTPTNNTSDSRSGFTSDQLDVDASYQVEQGKPLFEMTTDSFAKTDGQRLVEALGVSPQIFQHVQHSDGCDAREAIAMNRALWNATGGYFMEEMMRPVFDLDTIRKTRAFLTNYVSGRGSLAAIRVGKQPYGILPTSVFSRLQFAPGQDNFLPSLHNILRKMDETWTTLSQNVARAGVGNDPDKTLLDMLGLQASSVEFYQRLAVGPGYVWNFLAFDGLSDFAPRWNNVLTGAANQLVGELGFSFPQQPKIFSLEFFRKHTPLTGPVVDELPLDETRALKLISPEIGNYIDWLLQSDLDTIRNQNFGTDTNGQPRPAPSALLYLLLRHALLLAYWDATMKFTVDYRLAPPTARQEVELLNLKTAPDLTRWDYFEVKIPRVTGTLPLKQFLRTPAAGQFEQAHDLQELKDALAVLADLPTARLERLFAEHLDLFNYRLDAWQLGLINLRLQASSAQSPVIGPRPGIGRTGTYIGAFGWLEDLRPAPPRQPVPPNEIPSGFGDPQSPLTYAPNNGGFMHMPSLTHAETAAILRNAYITHASASNQDQMAVNLSSERVRRALWYFEGIRKGQKLGALLGYQFERGLHENQPGLDLDQYILPIRKKFPLAVDPNKTPPTDTPIEALAARNVVDGNALLNAYRTGTYPYAVVGLPTESSPEGQAIKAELDHIADSLDALGDVALTESVFQVAGGNFDRAGAMLDAITKGNNVPEPEVVHTPPSGIGLTQRVSINFHRGAPSTQPWAQVTAASYRADAEPRLNYWLGTLLGSPDQIRCQVWWITNPTTRAEQTMEVRLTNLQIQPIDLIYLASQDLTGAATEIEARILFYVRKSQSLARDQEMGIRFVERESMWGSDVKTFFEILPLVNSLREVVTGSRALSADDLALSTDPTPDTKNRKQIDVGELTARLDQARNALQNLIDNTLTPRIATVDTGDAPFDPTQLDPLRNALFDAVRFGIPDAIPASAIETTQAARDDLVTQAKNALKELTKRAQESDAARNKPAASTDQQAENLMQAFRAIFGRSYQVLPFFTMRNPSELQLAIANSSTILSGAPPLVVDEWLQGLARVNNKLANYQTVRLMAETFDANAGDALAVTVAQLPFAQNDRWLGLPFAPDQKITGDKLSLAMQLPVGFNTTDAQSGLMLDDWVEVIPSREETTGLAFHFDQPNSEPPQVLILVVSPGLRGTWKWQDLVDSLRETLDLAKKRAVEPDQIAETAYAQLLPALITAVARRNTTISTDLARNLNIPLYANEMKP